MSFLAPHFLGQSQRLFHAPMTQALPAGGTFTRAAGPASYWSAPLANGTVFITKWTAGNANVPRFCHHPSGGIGLLIEPARTQELGRSDFADADVDDLPDAGGADWTLGAGVAGVDSSVIVSATSPNGVAHVELADTAVATRGYRDTLPVALGAVTAQASVLARRSAGGDGATLYGFLTGGAPATRDIDIDPTGAAFDWTLCQGGGSTAGSGFGYCMQATGDPTGVVELCCPQIEVGAYASSFIPTDANLQGTRAVERYIPPAGSMSLTAGAGRYGMWSPWYDHDTFATDHVIWALSAVDYIMFRGADDRLVFFNNGVARALTAPLTFDRFDQMEVTWGYGPWGTRIGVDGTHVHDATAWVAPGAVVPGIGSDSAGANLEGAWYGDIEFWGA